MPPEVIPTISVIVPNYNHARYLRRRIDSILTQTYQDFELVLLDDCSTDSSREILATYADNTKVRLVYNTENSGSVFRQWNKGVRMALGRYVWIAESDDYADPRFLARLVQILKEQAEVAFAFCRSWSIGEHDEVFGYADSYLDRLDARHWTSDFIVDGREECRRFFALCDPIPNTSAVVFRRDVYEKIGLADERFQMCGDYKAWAMMALEGKIAYVADPLNYYRSHRENVRTRTESGALGIAEYFYVMLWILNCVVPSDTLPQKALIDELLKVLPAKQGPPERLLAAKQSLSYIAGWNLNQNSHVPVAALRAYFTDWDFALVGTEFTISAPSRWQFFLHRCRFYRHYFPRMGWKLRLVNFIRAVGALFVGYRHRHWAERTFARIVRELGAP
jgi:glycosyltransferase involved in cell wall biosynthesis